MREKFIEDVKNVYKSGEVGAIPFWEDKYEVDGKMCCCAVGAAMISNGIDSNSIAPRKQLTNKYNQILSLDYFYGVSNGFDDEMVDDLQGPHNRCTEDFMNGYQDGIKIAVFCKNNNMDKKLE